MRFYVAFMTFLLLISLFLGISTVNSPKGDKAPSNTISVTTESLKYEP